MSLEENATSQSQVLKSLFEDMKTPTPEATAAFQEQARKQKHEEGLERVSDSNTECNIPRRYWNVRFSDYPSEFNDKIKALCLERVSDAVLILSGTVGTGKTTILCSAIHERAYEGYTKGMYFSNRMLEAKLRTCRTFGSIQNEEQFLKEFSEYPFLCIDEVGTCSNRKEESDFLNTIICLRYENNLPTWIATNYSKIKLKLLLHNLDDSVLNGKSRDEIVALSEHLDKTNPTLNRIKSVEVSAVLDGDSHRRPTNERITL